MRPWATTAAVLMVYGLGAFSGWMGKSRLDVYHSQNNQKASSVTLPVQGPSPFQQIVDRDLDLTTEQRARVDQILADAQLNAQKVRQTINPQLRDLKLQTFLRVEAELSLDQRRKLRNSLQSLRAWQKRERSESNGTLTTKQDPSDR